MPFSKDSASTGADKAPGTEPNQFAQVGMGGSQGGGQFESGEGHSGSLQNQQGGTTTTESVPLGHEHEDAAGQQQQGGTPQRAPSLADEDGERERDDARREDGDQGNFGS